MEFQKESENTYGVYHEGVRIGHVTKTRVAVRPTDGSRIWSGKMRTAWMRGGNAYATRREAAESLLAAAGNGR